MDEVLDLSLSMSHSEQSDSSDSYPVVVVKEELSDDNDQLTSDEVTDTSNIQQNVKEEAACYSENLVRTTPEPCDVHKHINYHLSPQHSGRGCIDQMLPDKQHASSDSFDSPYPVAMMTEELSDDKEQLTSDEVTDTTNIQQIVKEDTTCYSDNSVITTSEHYDVHKHINCNLSPPHSGSGCIDKTDTPDISTPSYKVKKKQSRKCRGKLL